MLKYFCPKIFRKNWWKLAKKSLKIAKKVTEEFAKKSLKNCQKVIKTDCLWFAKKSSKIEKIAKKSLKSCNDRFALLRIAKTIVMLKKF